jgi:hypothetical protein
VVNRRTRPNDGEPDDVQSLAQRSWKEQLLEQLMSMPPDAIERLARRYCAKLTSTACTSPSKDGGIDGLGVYRLGLVSFPVSFTASATAAVSAPAPSATSAARWPGGAKRAF